MQVEETEKFIKTLCHKDQLIIRYRYEERLSWQEVADKIGDGMSSESYAHRHYRVIKGAMP
ncbi:hypothetical protein [Ruminococcus sp.]|uniref:hypothetical protein n=1 Tax=Ruminococcus sp. TaxID=41978 RepID=UPI0025F3BFAF|nr:hypothetical protein [Ruminococcus sp.]MBR1433037.1 hypothetical protein [Ruminococcus sp.]